MKPNHRRCVSCRRCGLKEEFWRIVRIYPSGQVQLDQGMGRSAYICPQSGCLQAAEKKNRLGRSLHASVPETLYQTLWQRLATTVKTRSASLQPRAASNLQQNLADKS
jgi:uncharacterized protein